MAGLLDLLGSDTGLLGLQLMAAGSAKPVKTGFGEGLLGALQNVQAQRAAEEEKRQRAAMQQMQMQSLQQTLQAQQQAAEERKAQMAAQQAAAQQRGGYLDSIDQSQGPAMPFNPVSAMRAGLRPEEMKMLGQNDAPDEYKVVGGSLVKIGRNGVTEAFKAPEKLNLNDLIIPGPDGKPIVNKALLDAKRQIASAGASSVVQYGSPVAGQDASGNPVFFQTNKSGGAPSIVPGVRPSASDKPLTEAQAKATVFQNQMAAAESELGRVERDPSKLTSQADIAMAASPLNILASPEAQRAKQAQEQWAESFLRFKTGAASTEEEVKRNVKTFFPQQGDKPDVIEQKARMRAQAQRDVAIAAGAKPQAPSGATVVRTGKDAQGRKVQQMSDGSIRYAD